MVQDILRKLCFIGIYAIFGLVKGYTVGVNVLNM